MEFVFEVLGATARSEPYTVLADLRQSQETWRIDTPGGGLVTRRCGLELAIATTYDASQGRASSLASARVEAAAHFARVLAERAEFEAPLRRKWGDPDEPPLGELPEGAGVIYCVEASQLVKIGYTRAGGLRQRLAALQTGSPERLRLRFAFPGTMEEERLLHQRLAKYRRHGEWFVRATAIDRDFAEMVRIRGAAR